MAEKDKDEKKAKKSIVRKSPKKVQTVRERTTSSDKAKPKRIRKAAGTAKGKVGKARKYSKTEYHIPLPDNKTGKFLGKRLRIVPKFVDQAFVEIKQVTWPSPKDTVRLTLAVFIFAIVFSAFVGILDYGFGQLFERFVINSNK